LQARDSYYSGRPLIVDDMFDKVEVNHHNPGFSFLQITIYLHLLTHPRLAVETPALRLQIRREVPALQPHQAVHLRRCRGNLFPHSHFFIMNNKARPVDVGQEDQSMFMALSSIWTLLLLFGSSAFLVPSLSALSFAFGDAFGARYLLYGAKSHDVITKVNDLTLIGLGFLVGYPIASASGKNNEQFVLSKIL
jgi:hypothetical protein